MRTADEIRAHTAVQLPGFRPRGKPTRMSGGSLNEVWRVPGEGRTVIVKYAPPHVATQPGIPLDPGRILFEARALRALGASGVLAGVPDVWARVPAILDLHVDNHVLVMEDLGDLPDLASAIADEGFDPEVAGAALGGFVGRLHAHSLETPALAHAFDNRAMQRTREEVQYQQVGSLCRDGGIAEPDRMGAIAAALGERFRTPGRCLTMGDLWPRSVLVDDQGLRVIDWELCHYGHPAQDIGHLAAHVWMHAHRAGSEAAGQRFQDLWWSFARGYGRQLQSDHQRDRLLDADTLAYAARHAGAEIIMRTLGPFAAGYLYEGLSFDAPPVAEALTVARGCLQQAEHPWLRAFDSAGQSTGHA